MWVDLGVGIVVVLYGLTGLFQGVIVQLFRLGGLVLIVFYARFVAEPIGQWLAGKLPGGWEGKAIAAYYGSFIVGSVIVYVVCALIGRGVSKAVSAGGGASRKVNRGLGGLLGLAKGLVVAFVLVSVLDMVPEPVLGRWPWAQVQAGESEILPRVHRVNPLPQMRFLADIDDYKKLLEDPEAQRILQNPQAFAGRPDFETLRLGQQALVELQNHPKFREAVGDAGLRQLLTDKEKKRWPEVLVHEKVLALGFDREIRGILNDENFRAAVKASLEEAAKARSKP